MTSFTVPDGLPRESLSDEPTSTLNGGSDGLTPILSDEVQRVLSELRATNADLLDRVTALEAIAAATRWRDIDDGTFTGGSLVISVPSGFQRLRLTFIAALSAVDIVGVRVNEDNTAGSHRFGRYEIDGAGTITAADFADSTRWEVMQIGGAEANLCILDVFAADGASPGQVDQPGFVAHTTRNSRHVGAHRMQHAWGSFHQPDAITSLSLLTPGATDFVGLRWWLEGYISP